MDNEEKLNIATKRWLHRAELTTSTVADGTIKKILSLCATPYVSSVTAGSGSVKVAGYVEYKALVVSSDDEILPMSFKSNFDNTFDITGVESNSTISVVCTSQNIHTTISDNGEFSLYCDLLFDFYILPNNTLNIAKGTETVMTKDGEMEYMTLLISDSQSFNNSTTIKRDAKLNKILCVKGSVGLKSAMSGTDYYSLSGILSLNIVYMTEDNAIRSMVKEEVVSNDLSIDGINKDSIIQAELNLGEMNIVESDDDITIDTAILVNTQVYNKETRTFIMDAYSIDREVNLTTTSFEQDTFLSTVSAEESLIYTIDISNDMPPIDRILATTPSNIMIANQKVSDGEVLLEGVATFNIVYFSEDDDGTKLLNSLDVDVPYSTSFSVKDVESDDLVVSHICVKDISIKSKHGRELEILADLFAYFNVSKTAIQAVTSTLTLGDVKPTPDYALEIYVARDGDTLWDVAKKLNISMADITMQNPSLTIPIKTGDKIVAYHKRLEQ